jgi:hypothetical protein
MPAAMHRLARHLFTFCSAVSLLLCVAVCVLWVSSGSTSFHVKWSKPLTRYDLRIYQGDCLAIHSSDTNPPSDSNPLQQTVSFDSYVSSREGTEETKPIGLRELIELIARGKQHEFGAFVAFSAPALPPATQSVHGFAFPLWFPLAMATILPMVWLISRYRHANRHRRGLCSRCGYDLRATPEQCPECGTPARAAIFGASSVQSLL